MKFTKQLRQRIVLGIGIGLILFGIAEAYFKFTVDRAVTDRVSFWLMILAVALLFMKDKPEPKPEEPPAEATLPELESGDGPEQK